MPTSVITCMLHIRTEANQDGMASVCLSGEKSIWATDSALPVSMSPDVSVGTL